MGLRLGKLLGGVVDKVTEPPFSSCFAGLSLEPTTAKECREVIENYQALIAEEKNPAERAAFEQEVAQLRQLETTLLARERNRDGF